MVISKRKELRTHDQSTKLFENPEQLMKERGTCETKKVQPKQLEGTECITDPAPSTPRKLKLKKPENGSGTKLDKLDKAPGQFKEDAQRN